MITWSQALTQAQNLAQDTSTEAKDFFSLWLNVKYKELLADFGRPHTEKKKTTTTVANQQSYQLPPDILWVKTVTITVGNTTDPLIEVEDQDAWNRMNATPVTGIPRWFFYRPRFGINGGELQLLPIPSASNYTITLIGEANDKDLSADTYSDGTVTVTEGSAVVNGSGTTFTSAMVGRYFRSNGSLSDGFWYRIAARNSNTSITLENVYEGATQSGATYQIDEAFALPEEMQQLPIWGALAEYYGMKQNTEQEAKYLAKFTAGLQNAKKRYGTKTRNNIIRKKLPYLRQSSYPLNFPQVIN
jgi:hypothetical protein